MPSVQRDFLKDKKKRKFENYQLKIIKPNRNNPREKNAIVIKLSFVLRGTNVNKFEWVGVRSSGAWPEAQ